MADSTLPRAGLIPSWLPYRVLTLSHLNKQAIECENNSVQLKVDTSPYTTQNVVWLLSLPHWSNVRKASLIVVRGYCNGLQNIGFTRKRVSSIRIDSGKETNVTCFASSRGRKFTKKHSSSKTNRVMNAFTVLFAGRLVRHKRCERSIETSI